MLTGYIMDKFIDKRQGFIWGMRVIFWWVIITLIFFIISYFIIEKKIYFRKNNGTIGEFEYD